jgi:hypothetical protein
MSWWEKGKVKRKRRHECRGGGYDLGSRDCLGDMTSFLLGLWLAVEFVSGWKAMW